MADNSWVLDIESKVFSIVKAKTITQLKTDYPKIKYTTNDENVEPITVFPTVYLHEISSVPVGDGLDAKTINGVLSTFEVRVTVNTNKTDLKKVVAKIHDGFSDLRFYTTSNPIITNDSGMFIANFRVRRTIGYSDDISK